MAIDLDDSEVRQGIGADELRRIDVAVAHGDADVDGAGNDVVVGDDVAVGRDDDAAAEAVLNGGLLLLHHRALEELTEGRARTEELLELLLLLLLRLFLAVFAFAFVFGDLTLAQFRGDADIDHGGTNARGERLHGLIEGQQRRDAAFVDGSRCRRWGR